jgi:serine protease Do
MSNQGQERWMGMTARRLGITLILVVTLAAGILIGTVVSGRVSATREQNGEGAGLLAVPNPVQLSTAFSSIAERLEPAVVNISTTSVPEPRRQAQRRTPRQPDPFQDFFDRFFDFPDQGTPRASRSLGSGIIVDKKGFILTNNHVVDGANKIQVRMQGDPKTYSARIIGTDSETDLAVIKIDAEKDLPVARMGNSDAVRVGDWVLAIGSPFGLEATVTAGIVSARDRSPNVTQAGQFQRFLQTDAAINPGNSGGPLVNMAGEVIGINTAIVTTSRGFDGVGFALPSNAAIGVYNQLAQYGKVTRGSIGITFEEGRSNNPVTLKELGAQHGIIIEYVEPGSPAEKAGLRPTDVITEVNGQPVRTGTDLVNPISATPIGGRVRITYVRDRKRMEATLTVEDRNKVFAARNATQDEDSPESTPAEFGLRLEAMTPELLQRLGLNAATQGVIVSGVEPASFAEDLGFLRGDVIIEANRAAVRSPSELRRIISALQPGAEVSFKVLRRLGTTGDGQARFGTVLLSGIVPKTEQ